MPTKTAPVVSRVLFGALLWAAGIAVAHTVTPAPVDAVVTATEGPPFEFARGARLFTGTRGTHLSAGDLIKTQPGSLLILEFNAVGTQIPSSDGAGQSVDAGQSVKAAAAVGASSRIYWMDRADAVALAVLGGSIKIDALARGQHVITEGARLRAASESGSYVMYVGDAADEVFHEKGSMKLEVSYAAHGDGSVPSRPEQLTLRSSNGQIQTRLGADAAFVQLLPPAFLDPLPTGLGAQLRSVAQPQFVRYVTYADVSDWLAAPRPWRRGFVRRFQARLKDPLFFQELDAQMSLHPEWGPILHPPTTLTLSSASQQH